MRNGFRVSQERAESAVPHHGFILHALAEAVNQVAIDVHARRGVGKVRVPLVVDMSPADVQADFAHERL